MNTEIIYNGKIWHLWSAIYLYDGKTYSLEFYAESNAENKEDAKARIKAIRETLTDGHQILDVVHAEDVDDDFDPDKYMDGLKGE